MEKVCSKCKRLLPLDKNHFWVDNRSKTGFKSRCRECLGSYFVKVGFKTCAKCNAEYEVNKENFYSDKKSRDGLTSYCKKCIDERNKEYALSHKEQIRKTWEKHYESNKDKVRKRSETYRLSHMEHINKRNRIKYKTDKEYKNGVIKRNKRYIDCNPYKKREYKHKRRSREKELIATFTSEQWDKCLIHFKHKCAYCGIKDEKLTQDHFIPVSKGGEYTFKNIVPSCSYCNSSKGNRDFYSWYRDLDFYDETKEKKIIKYLGYENHMQQLALL